MILIDNKEGLIGDFLGTIPAMQELAKEDCVLLEYRKEVKGLYDLILSDKIESKFSKKEILDKEFKTITLSSSEAFQIAAKYNCYMSQAFFVQAGLEFPKVPPKAKLTLEDVFDLDPCDYLISPFARSLPENQKWPVEKWRELVRSFPDKKFGLLGNSKYDDKNYLEEENVLPIFDFHFNTVCNVMRDTGILISVVTGTSHLAFHLGVKNILLTSQTMAWGNNPDAIQIKKPIENITVKEVIEKL